MVDEWHGMHGWRISKENTGRIDGELRENLTALLYYAAKSYSGAKISVYIWIEIVLKAHKLIGVRHLIMVYELRVWSSREMKRYSI
jgi:hypothetical protein